jgi:hypothetical protein
MMGLYAWVRALRRFAHNVHVALHSVMKVIDATEMLLIRIVIFVGFLYGVYAWAHH